MSVGLDTHGWVSINGSSTEIEAEHEAAEDMRIGMDVYFIFGVTVFFLIVVCSVVTFCCRVCSDNVARFVNAPTCSHRCYLCRTFMACLCCGCAVKRFRRWLHRRRERERQRAELPTIRVEDYSDGPPSRRRPKPRDSDRLEPEESNEILSRISSASDLTAANTFEEIPLVSVSSRASPAHQPGPASCGPSPAVEHNTLPGSTADSPFPSQQRTLPEATPGGAFAERGTPPGSATGSSADQLNSSSSSDSSVPAFLSYVPETSV